MPILTIFINVTFCCLQSSKKEKKSKKKDKKTEDDDAPAAEESSDAPAEPKRAQRATSNVFALFNQAQIQEFKEVGPLGVLIISYVTHGGSCDTHCDFLV